MRKLVLSLALSVCLVIPTHAQTTDRTPQQVISEIETLLNELKGLLAPQPAPEPVTTVANAAELSTALTVGGTIELAPGTYNGNFKITKPTILRGTGATIVPTDIYRAGLTVLSNDVVVRDLTVQLMKVDRDSVVVGSTTATTVEEQPHRVLFEDVTVLATPDGGHRGFSLHGVDITLRRVTVKGFIEAGRDSQAVFINNGPGPYTVEDSYLEGSGENLLVGGDSIRIPNVVPSDITIRGNTFFKPQEWRQRTGSVKNLLELKAGRRVLIENNVFDGCWKDAQAGHPIAFTPRNQYGDSPWVTVDEVIFRYNIIKNTPQGYGVNILGTDNNHESQHIGTITIDHNLFVDSPNGIQVGEGVTTLLTVTNNTFPAVRHNLLGFYGTRDASGVPVYKTPLIFKQNAVKSGEYGVSGTGFSVGYPALTAYAVLQDFTENVIEKSAVRYIKWPDGNRLVEPGALTSLLEPTTFKMLDGSAGY